MISFDISFWHWWVLGIGLFTIEIFVPGAFFMWIGFGAILVGIIDTCLLIFKQSLSLQNQIILFAIFSLLSVMIGRKWLRRHPITTTHSTLNRRGEQYVGRKLTLSDPIINGRGHVRLDDTLWSVTGPDCSAKTLVEIINVDGSLLVVQPAPGQSKNDK